MLGSTTTLSIFRLIYGTATNTYPATADLTGVEAFIEAQKGELTAVLGQGLNVEVFLAYCDPITVEAGDKVTDAEGNEYRVAGVERHESNPEVEDVYMLTLHRQKSTVH